MIEKGRIVIIFSQDKIYFMLFIYKALNKRENVLVHLGVINSIFKFLMEDKSISIMYMVMKKNKGEINL